MFYVIYFAVIAFALYFIFHDRFGEEGQRKRMSSDQPANAYHPEPQARVPQTPESPEPQTINPAPRTINPAPRTVNPAPRTVNPAPKPQKPNTVPVNPAPRIVPPAPARPAAPTYGVTKPEERELSWSYLYKLEYDEALAGDVMETEVTGMRHYCTLADLGPVNGIIQPEPENPQDPKAQAVIRSDGKKLGYIARNNLPQYEFFNPTNAVCPFAGHVKVTRQGYIWADILVALPLDRDFVKDELSAYLDADLNES